MRLKPLAVLSLALVGTAGLAFATLDPVVWAQTPAKQQPGPQPVAQAQADPLAVLNRYCVACHNSSAKAGGLTLEGLDLARVHETLGTWEKVRGKMRSRAMPPAGMPHPDEATYEAVAAVIEQALDREAAMNPNPGRTPAMHRLNRNEYRNAVRDLLDLDIDVSAMLPADSSSYGFDNIAGVLSVSPTLMDRYVLASQKIATLAVGSQVPVTANAFPIPGDLLQDDRMPGLPYGTRGGMGVEYAFPQDGEYEFRMRLGRDQIDNLSGLTEESQIEVSIDGQQVKVLTIGRKGAPGSALRTAGMGQSGRLDESSLTFRTPIKAGKRFVAVTFIKRTDAYPEVVLEPQLRVNSGLGGDSRYQPFLTNVVITGPFNAKVGVTPSRQKIFTCTPKSASAETACARQIITKLATQAYRRPATKADTDLLMDFYAKGRASGTFESGVEMALRRILVDPEFLFRISRDPVKATNVSYTLGDLELASRLSFFLWSAGPDAELLNLAQKGQLKKQAVLEKQVKRMLADPRSDALVSNFAGQWLYLRNLASLQPDADRFPDFDDSLRQSMRQESEMFFASIMREDRSVLTFLDADYTYLNERLARNYDMKGVYGPEFRKVKLTDPNRGGLLGQAAILAATSEPTRTSPVRRGKWVLENILGAPPPPAPPNIPTLKEPESGSTALLSMRAQMEEHRKNPGCASCHRVMDPIGFALDNYDVLGRWRGDTAWILTPDDGKWRLNSADSKIDASGVLPNGVAFTGPAGLKKALLKDPDAFVETLTDKLMIYAVGRGMEDYDKPAIRQIVRDAKAKDYHFSTIILGIVDSKPFRMRAVASPDRPIIRADAATGGAATTKEQ